LTLMVSLPAEPVAALHVCFSFIALTRNMTESLP
jgi:hypothetical protein